MTLPDGLSKAQVLKLTNPGVDIAHSITFMGQHVNEYVKLVGVKAYERVLGGKVLLGAGEAVLSKSLEQVRSSALST